MFTVYVLKSELTGRFYTGHTSDLKARLAKHEAGATKTTRGKGPWKVVYTEEFSSKADAIKREVELKRMKSRGIYEKLKAR